jgi:hypothetical protein
MSGARVVVVVGDGEAGLSHALSKESLLQVPSDHPEYLFDQILCPYTGRGGTMIETPLRGIEAAWIVLPGLW